MRPSRHLRGALLALAVLAASPVALAAGWGALLRNSPGEDFNDEDLRQFLAASKQALEAPGEPKTLEWSNSESGAGGSFLVLGQPKVKDFSECRRTRIKLHSKKRKGYAAVYTACKDASGRWRLVGAG
jgi:surface antigen